jgi:hypothetical protein
MDDPGLGSLSTGMDSRLTLLLTWSAWSATLSRMTVRDLLVELQHLPRDLEVLAFEAG